MKRPVKGGRVHPWLPVPYEKEDAYAVQALFSGTASENQQRRVVDFLCRTTGAYDLSYRPDSERDTSFAEGGRFVWLQLLKLRDVRFDTKEPK